MLQDTTTVCQNGRFYPLDETKNLGNRTRNGRNSFGYSNDNIPIMVLDGQNHDDLWKRHDMSPLRRFCLVASVLLCILTILVFLYVLPCDNSSICLSAPEPKTSVSWDKTLEGIGEYFDLCDLSIFIRHKALIIEINTFQSCMEKLQ
jgi:hypothetical protein